MASAWASSGDARSSSRSPTKYFGCSRTSIRSPAHLHRAALEGAQRQGLPDLARGIADEDRHRRLLGGVAVEIVRQHRAVAGDQHRPYDSPGPAAVAGRRSAPPFLRRGPPPRSRAPGRSFCSKPSFSSRRASSPRALFGLSASIDSIAASSSSIEPAFSVRAGAARPSSPARRSPGPTGEP